MRVFVYWNLHKKVWSVKALEGPHKGRVITRSPWVTLRDVTPRVSEAGRQRVLREQRKNVHAGLVGELVRTTRRSDEPEGRGITYNPYKFSSFVHRDDETPYEGSPLAYLNESQVTAA
ncbi:hypothetical protein [Rhodococcus phage RGL3]|uniref:Uncharacterized protein n=1 Tax=Rhodococcus phage RGL3 TaxID=2922221 RepID=G9FHP6_9CAUD|nr:hypothetical protein RoPhRGL3_gp54 [Rhodococcus phage RGL3]AEV52134.1 hypothetical protein [Rhodococcus phage RGL3]